MPPSPQQDAHLFFMMRVPENACDANKIGIGTKSS
jgi:hypothetical protein